jgi:hypothetical protein
MLMQKVLSVRVYAIPGVEKVIIGLHRKTSVHEKGMIRVRILKARGIRGVVAISKKPSVHSLEIIYDTRLTLMG